MLIVIKRYMELLLWSFITSIAASSIYMLIQAGINEVLYGVLLLVAMGLFIAVNVSQLRMCYADMHGSGWYYGFNYIAYGLFALSITVVYYIFGETAYAWLFSVTKFMKMTDFEWTTMQSTVLFHGIMLLVIAIAPIGMGWVFDFSGDEFDDADETEETEENYEKPNDASATE